MTYELFLTKLSAPARRALAHHDIYSFEQLATFTEKEILSFHGIGPTALPVMKEALAQAQLAFKDTPF